MMTTLSFRRLRLLAEHAAAATLIAASLFSAPAIAQNTAGPTGTETLVADFNHDGLPDLLVTSTSTFTATIAFGSTPYGTFAANPTAVTFPAGCTGVTSGAVNVGNLVAADFNADGFPDLYFTCITSSSGASITGVMLGRGDGTFAAPVLLNAPYANSGTAADFNHDGKMDLVLVSYPNGFYFGTNNQHPALLFFAGNGDGTFAAPVTSALGTSPTFEPGQFQFTSPVAADVDGDGYPDIVLNSAYGYSQTSLNGATLSISVFGNRHDGTFGTAAEATRLPDVTAAVGTYPATSQDLKVLTGNFFNNALPAFAVPALGAKPGIYLVRNTSSQGVFSLATPAFTTYPALQSVATGTFTSSGLTDLAVADGAAIAALINDGTGNFGGAGANPVIFNGLKIASTNTLFALADANGDGYSDIYTASGSGTGLSLAVNLVSGTATATSQPFPLSMGIVPLTATWSGNLNYSGTTLSGTQTVLGTPTAVVLTSNLNPAPVGTPVTFTAVAASAVPVDTTLTGSIVFTDGTTTLGSVPLDNNGTATLTVSTLTAATHTIQAAYTGDNFFAASTGILSQGVTAPGQLTSNLLLNPGAELGSIQFWTATGPGTPTVDSGTFDGGINPHSGAYDFLGHDGASDSLSQTVSLVTPGVTAAMLDTGTLRAALSFYEQGLNQGTPSDDAFVTLTFLDANGATLGTVNSGEVDSHNSAWQNFSNAYPIPTGTRSVTYTMNFMRHAGSDLDGFVDDNSLLILGAAPVAGVPTLTWIPPAAIPFGTPLSSTQLDATATNLTGATIPGVFTYTPAAGAILPVGIQTLSVLFTPTDLSAFTTATTTVPLTVLPSTPTATLAITSGTSAVKTVPQGTAITLTATVLSGTAPITPGQVRFCDASGPSCTDIHLLGTVQLTAAGTATLRLTPGIGAHPYKAVFLGTTSYTTASATGVVVVTGVHPSTTTLGQAGTPGNYTLTATTTGSGSAAQLTGTISFVDTTNANAVLATAPVGTIVSALSLSTATTPATGAGALTVFPGDFNNDGKADLAVLNQMASTVTILLGKGDGTFTVSANVPTPFGAYFITAADFNNDGALDLAVDLFTDVSGVGPTGSVTIIPGNGDGTFAAPLTPISLPGPVAIATGDFNGDGIVDLAVVLTDLQNGTVANSSVAILLGKGDGSFQNGPTIPTGAGPQSVAVGDFNNDGRLDLATANYVDNTISVLLGNGDGSFTPTISSPATGSFPRSVRTADFNGDGNLDLVVANAGGTTLSVFLGNGKGSFTPTATSPATGKTPNAIGVADFNADGTPDLAVTNYGDSTTSIYTGKGDGSFAAPITTTIGASPLGIAAADFNGDGIADIAASSSVAGNATILLTQLTQTGIAATASINPIGTGTHQVIATYPGDTNYAASTSGAVALIAQHLSPVLTWTPTQATIPYGTALGPQQLDAVATTPAGAILPGTYSYTPGAGTILSTGTQTISLIFTPTSPSYAPVSTTQIITVTQASPAVVWPSPAAITYGTALSATQLNATANTPGTFTYTPAAGTILAAGTRTLSVTFIPTDTLDYTALTTTRTLTVAQARPTLTWPTPAPVFAGTALSATQLNATATGVTGAALPGTFAYTPNAGSVPAAGTQTLSVTFVPTDSLDYTTASASVQLQVNTFTLTAITPSTAKVADPDKLITLTGTGFTTGSLAQVNGARVATTFVNATTLTAIVPAANFAAVATLQVAVINPATSAATASLPLAVTAPTPAVTLSGPATTSPGTQPTLAFAISNPYPIPLTATFALTFASAVTPAVDDPSIQFAGGGRTYTFTVPANSTTVPAVQLQAGTVAGTITIPLTLTAAGVNVTPTTVQPVVIVVPGTVPAVSAATLTRTGDQLTVTIHGFSNTREVAQAAFHFMPTTGAVIDTPDVTVPVTAIFSSWFASAPSTQYGSSFTYTQIFTVSDTTANIGSVQVTLTNAVGVSTIYTAQ